MKNIRDTNGAALAEYVVLMAFLSLVGFSAVVSLGDAIHDTYTDTADAVAEVEVYIEEANPESCTQFTPNIGYLSPDGTGTLWTYCAETGQPAETETEDEDDGGSAGDTGDMGEDDGSGWCPPDDWTYVASESLFEVPGSVTPQPVLSGFAHEGGVVTVEVNDSDALGPDYTTDLSYPVNIDQYWWGNYYGVTLVIWNSWSYTGEIHADDIYLPDPSCP